LRGCWDLVCIELGSGRPKRMPAEFLKVYGAAIQAQLGQPDAIAQAGPVIVPATP
jgi:hypothetical protein